MLKEARNAYISDYLGEGIEENPKRFWSYSTAQKEVDSLESRNEEFWNIHELEFA